MKKIKNGISYELNGWLYVSVKGSPRERGYAYGYLVANEMKKVLTGYSSVNLNEEISKIKSQHTVLSQYIKNKLHS